MTPEQITAADDACYLALKARDARFDGCFFTGVTSTGIYCRPVCSVKAPKRENCRFFGLAAQAESAGFRPCLRCRPELAPHSVVWSIQDASYILAHQAARLLDEPDSWAPTLVASRTSLPPGGAAGRGSEPANAGLDGMQMGGVSPPGGLQGLRLRPGKAGSAAPAGEDHVSRLVTSSTSPPAGLQGLRPGPSTSAGQAKASSVARAGEERSSGVIAGLASRLGISDRHLRRIFEAQFGVSPVQYLQTRRLLTAKQLLADTALPITQVALISGFGSVRRFNAAFVGHYGLNPTQLRRQGAPQAGHGIVVRLGYRPPYDVAAMLGFFSRRALDGVELIDAEARQPVLRRTLRLDLAGQTRTGWISAQFDAPRSQLLLQVSDTLREVLPLVIRRVRAAFDLDADPKAVNSVLHASFPAGDGLRVPGALDGYELAVRAVLGQQITVAAGRTLAQRLVMQFGEAVETPWPQLTRLFPAPEVLAAARGEALGRLGIVRQRQAAITSIARAVADNRLPLHGGADMHATVGALKALPGIGDWTAQYIAMRALRWPDAFPAGDVALHKALGLQGLKNPAKHAELASQAWKPWRSYAVIRAWSGAFTEPATAALPEPARKPASVAIDLIAARAVSTWAAA